MIKLTLRHNLLGYLTLRNFDSLNTLDTYLKTLSANMSQGIKTDVKFIDENETRHRNVILQIKENKE